MTAVRVIAVQPDIPGEKIVFIGQVSESDKLIAGEWMGYIIESDDGESYEKYPCVLTVDGTPRFDFCGWYQADEIDVRPYPTNIFERAIRVGEYFTITCDGEELTYRIKSVHRIL